MAEPVTQPMPGSSPVYACDVDDVVQSLGSNVGTGLGSADAARRLEADGPNEITGEAPPSLR